MSGTHPSRRRFLTKGAAAAGLVASAPALELAGGSAAAAAQAPVVADNNAIESVLYGQRSRFVTTTREIEGRSHSQTPRIRPNPQRPSARTPLAELTGTITPTSLHFTTQHYYGIPDINPAEHTLMVEGMVDRPLVFTMDELRRMPFVSRVHFLECVGNRPNPRGATVTATHGRMACSEWTGVPLSVLLDEVGVRDGASWIIAEATDGGRHTKSVPLAKALDDVLVAYGQNGEPVRPDHGFPLRLLVPGFEGIYNVKWLKRIKVVDQPYLSFQEQSRFLTPDPKTQRDSYDFGPNSVITQPSGAQRAAGARPPASSAGWRGRAAARSPGSRCRPTAVRPTRRRTWSARCCRRPTPASACPGAGTATRRCCSRGASTSATSFSQPKPSTRTTGVSPEGSSTGRSRASSATATGFSRGR